MSKGLLSCCWVDSRRASGPYEGTCGVAGLPPTLPQPTPPIELNGSAVCGAKAGVRVGATALDGACGAIPTGCCCSCCIYCC